MSTARVIKKYPNRRLYDTEQSRYITLADVRGLILAGVEFTVIDKKSGRDITRSILLQVITELEQDGLAIMSRAFLSQIIRSYGKAPPGAIGDCLEQSLARFLAEQPASRQPVQRVGGTASLRPARPAGDVPPHVEGEALPKERKKAG